MHSSSGQITLSGNPTFQTTDPDKAGQHLSPYLCHHTVNTRHDKDLFFKHFHTDVGRIGLHLLRYGVDLTITGTPGSDCYILLLLLAGFMLVPAVISAAVSAMAMGSSVTDVRPSKSSRCLGCP